VILTVWLVGSASWFVNATAIHSSALAIEPSPLRDASVAVSGFINDLSKRVGVGSVENVIDRLRDRNRDGISLVDQTIAQDAPIDPIDPVPEVELVTITNRPGDALLLNSVPVLDPTEFVRDKVGKTIRVLVTGDSLSTYAGQELVKLMAEDERFVIRIEWANGSGLTKPNVLDWAQYARDVTAKYQPDLVIVILGGNDTVNMVQGGELVDRSSAEWVSEYSRRTQLVVNEFIANKVTNVVWAGPPPVRDKNRNFSYSQINLGLQQAASQLETLKLLDTFSNILPKLSAQVAGKPMLLRQTDGIHWTREASRLIAIELQAMLVELRP
jgi:lysophospholipase L1-like esterase